jgi:hypothetical protein
LRFWRRWLRKARPYCWSNRSAPALVHNDGTPKYVWPAVKPDAFREGGAWYANTGSFILDRLTVRVSAASANATHCLVMVLDDIGTKSKVPPLKPSWIIETSAGNYQYGYVLGVQPTTGDFSAAIIAIAAAGYTDGGAINPVRNFRIPGSVNFKRGDFVSRLEAFNPELEYTLPEICAALGVVPALADTAQTRPLRIEDDGGDDVLAWLDKRGNIMEPKNGQGWLGVLCPNALEHSDGNTMGRYMPATRSYTCFHEHCGDWDSRRFLNWVEQEGGPKHQPGLRDTLIAGVMADALAKISPTNMFTDDAATVLADIERVVSWAGWTGPIGGHALPTFKQMTTTLTSRRGVNCRAQPSTRFTGTSTAVLFTTAARLKPAYPLTKNVRRRRLRPLPE